MNKKVKTNSESETPTESDVLSSDYYSRSDVKIPVVKQPTASKSDLPLRIVTSTTLISFQVLTFCMGHFYYSVFLLLCGFKCYFELIKINKVEQKENKIPFQVLIDWLVPLGFCFYLLPYTLIRRVLVDNDSIHNFKLEYPNLYAAMFIHHTFISAMLLILGLVVFVLSLETGAYKKYQFKRLAWQVMVTLVSISGSLFFGYYVFKGYFWVIMTNGSVMMNDIMAYVFGRTFGKHQLTRLSPKKTVEGFIGGAISTVLIALWLSNVLSNHQQFYCPQKEIIFSPFMQLECKKPTLYVQKVYSTFFGDFTLSPAQLHAAVIAIFAALIAPFGGFLASGLKRSMKIKDFSDSIPGHGGFADRFDCHIVCAFFVYVYLTQVVYRTTYSTERVFDYIQKMDHADKLKVYNMLKATLENVTLT